MAANGAVVSYSGGPPGRVREANAFDWIFEDPFQQENDYTSSERRLAKIEGDRPIFVDNKTGKTIDSSSLDYSYDPHPGHQAASHIQRVASQLGGQTTSPNDISFPVTSRAVMLTKPVSRPSPHILSDQTRCPCSGRGTQAAWFGP